MKALLAEKLEKESKERDTTIKMMQELKEKL